MVKNSPVTQETWFDPWVGKIPWRWKWQPTPVILSGKSHRPEEPGRIQLIGPQKDLHTT